MTTHDRVGEIWIPLWIVGGVFAVAAIGNRALPGAPLGLQVIHVVCALAIGAVVLGWCLNRPTTLALTARWQSPAAPALGWALLFVVATAAATAVSTTPDKSVKATATLLAGVLLAGAIVAAARTPLARRILAATAVLASLAVTLPALAHADQLSSRLDGAVVNNRPTVAFADPNEFGSYCALIALLALGWLLTARRRVERLAALVGLVAATGGLALSMSRGAWIGASLGVLVLVVLHPGARRMLALLAGGALLMLAVGWLVLPAGGPLQAIGDRAASIANPSANPYDVRPLTWGEAMREFSRAPLLGNGPGSFSVRSAESPSTIQFYPRRHAHNGALTVLAETGVLGLLTLGGFGAALLRAGWRHAAALRRIRGAELGLVAGVGGGLVALVGHLSVDFPLRNPTLLITVWALIGLLLASVAHPEPR